LRLQVARWHEGRRQTVRSDDLGADGKASCDIPALKPYWGKPPYGVLGERNWVWFLTIYWYWPTILLLPASAERFVQLDEASVFIAPRGCKRQFRTVKRPLSVEHFEIGRCAAFVAQGGNADRLLQVRH